MGIGALAGFVDLPWFEGIGFRSMFGTVIPPSSRVQFVRSSGWRSYDPEYVKQQTVKTLEEALAKCTAGAGDVIFVLPGYTKSVGTTLFSNLVAGTRIIGIGSPDQDDAPTLTWDAQAANLDIDAKNVLVSGFRMMMNGANDITEAISVSKAGVKLIGNYIVTGTGASLDCAKAIDVELGATDFLFAHNKVRQTGGTTTAVLALAAVVDNVEIANNDIIMIGSAATGMIDISAAATNVNIHDNVLRQQNAASTACISVADVASTGIIYRNLCQCLNDGVAAAQGVVFAGVGTTTIMAFDNMSVDEAGKSGVLAPAAVAT
jgi:hypothetical protein